MNNYSRKSLFHKKGIPGKEKSELNLGFTFTIENRALEGFDPAAVA